MRKTVMDMPPFYAMEVMERSRELERQGRSIIHLEVGEPDFPTPSCITEAATKAIRDGKTRYTSSLGILELREAIAEHFLEKYGVSVSPDQIIVMNGSSPGLFSAFSALLEEGDEVIISNPHYPCYPNFVTFLGCTPKFVKVSEHDGFQYNPDDIKEKINPRTRAIMINSPGNPTGQVLDTDALSRIATLGPAVVSDEIYHGLVFEGKEHSILEFTKNAFVISGFSKQFAMTGWRLGYVIAPKKYVRPLQKLVQNFFISANTITQWAGIAALKEAATDVQRMVNIYDKRRKLMIQSLRKIGFSIAVEPTGAFYVFANAKRFTNDSLKFSFELLEKAGVGTTPGIDFGSNAEGYIRFSYTNSIENISKGIDRLEHYLKTKAENHPET
ncbi:MAG: pyridoxal phosphate-dependent aminotransferase [Candidatus Bathyarchaeota archaeon]|nr:MAG: pyridoxal phosphate-dependent aminotransferase [Candidatus Bathyarchaeota archaeon]